MAKSNPEIQELKIMKRVREKIPPSKKENIVKSKGGHQNIIKIRNVI